MGSKENYRVTRDYYERIGKCVRCRINHVVPKKRYCVSCIKLINEYQKEYREKNKERISERNKLKYQYYKDNNICPDCKTKRKNKSKYVYCLACRKKAFDKKEKIILRKKGFL